MKFYLKQAAMVLAAALACQVSAAWPQTPFQDNASVQPTPVAETAKETVQQPDSAPSLYAEFLNYRQASNCGQLPPCNPTPAPSGQNCGMLCEQSTICDQNCPPVCDQKCGMCGRASGQCGCCNKLGCDECPNWGLLAFAGLDSFKGISDGSFENNFGAVTGLNAGAPIPGLKDRGIGWQLGLSYGVYDWDGWGAEGIARPHRHSSQQQLFVTTGLFRKAQGDQRLSYGLVYDWMANRNWGEYIANNPTLGQWRGQIEYSLSGCNAIGIWGCVRDRYSFQVVDPSFPIVNRPISQANLFWHHKFNSGADSRLYFGFPQSDRLRGIFDNGGRSLGSWMIGANFETPLSDRLALYANGSYFHPSASASAIAAIESGYDVGVGVVWYYGRNAQSRSINGKCWTPYMPMANNSNFLVDQSDAY